ncbi:hypothetical protein KSX_54220 [Ktedonospora formicarum]|uniref:Uncharacterized protein n=1 Tax=Ktedonospora formicarum TaxID=2778364 RepID=A0A8J3I9Q8_9CHLR|nr:hypothetical protein KSX_54220 [Ktedonospora formicarum]
MSSLRGALDQPKERVRAAGETHACHQASPGFSAKSKANQGEDIGESHCASRIGRNDGGKPLGENLAWALVILAKKAAGMQF